MGAGPRGGSSWGKLFEHFVVLELRRFIDYHHKNWQMFFWRTSQGHEVDVIIKAEDRIYALEIKGGKNIDGRDMKGLKMFMEENPRCVPLCVSTAEMPFFLDGIPVIPWRSLFGEEYLGKAAA